MSKKAWAVAKVVGIVLGTMYLARRIRVVDEALGIAFDVDYLIE